MILVDVKNNCLCKRKDNKGENELKNQEIIDKLFKPSSETLTEVSSRIWLRATPT